MDRNTTFSDEEVRRILRRAADREEAAAGGIFPPDRRALTLRDIEEIGRSVGIPPEYIDGAAHEIAYARGSPEATSRFGIPAMVQDQRRLPRLPEDAEWEAMVAEFRRVFGRHGFASQVGAVREWSSAAGDEGDLPVRVFLRPVEGGATLTARVDAGAMTKAPAAVGGMMGGTALLLGVLLMVGDFSGATFGVIPWLLGTGALLVPTLVYGTRWWMRARLEKIRGALDAAERKIRPQPSHELSGG